MLLWRPTQTSTSIHQKDKKIGYDLPAENATNVYILEIKQYIHVEQFTNKP